MISSANGVSSFGITSDSVTTLTNKTIAAADNTLTGVINNTLTTTTGDIIYASAANTPARLAIGSTDQVLKVSGGVPVWAAPAAPALVGVAATATSQTLAVTANVTAMLPLPTENFDTDAFHDNTTNNSRITIPAGKGGKYLVNIEFQNDSTANYAFIYFSKNGTLTGMASGSPGAFMARIQGNSGNTYGLRGAIIVELAATDYIEAGFFSDVSRTMTYDARFSAIFLGA